MEKNTGTVGVSDTAIDWLQRGLVRNRTQQALILRLSQRPEGVRSAELPEIASEIGVGLKTVQLAVRALVRRGMMTFTEESSRRRRYTLNTDWKPNTSA